jgi:hypothetical protein
VFIDSETVTIGASRYFGRRQIWLRYELFYTPILEEREGHAMPNILFRNSFGKSAYKFYGISNRQTPTRDDPPNLGFGDGLTNLHKKKSTPG